MSILQLPNELLQIIAQYLSPSKLNLLARTCPSLYCRLNCVLYDINVRKYHGFALAWAAENDRIDTVKLLMNSGAHLDIQFGVYKATALHLAALSGHALMARFLVDHGATMITWDNRQYSPLHYAAAAGQLDVVKLFVGRQVHPDLAFKDPNGSTPLHLAAKNAHETVVRFLRQYGANVARLTESRGTVLHLALNQAFLSRVCSLRTKSEIHQAQQKPQLP